MKIKIKREKPCRNADYERHLKHWKEAEPFVLNHRGILVHRVRYAKTFLHDNGKRSHDAVSYWCGNCCTSSVMELMAVPSEGRLLCARCEALAVAAGEASADFIAGRHVHIGHLRAVRDCCKAEGN